MTMPPRNRETGLPPENLDLPLFCHVLPSFAKFCQVLQIFGHIAKHPPLLAKNLEKVGIPTYFRYTDHGGSPGLEGRHPARHWRQAPGAAQAVPGEPPVEEAWHQACQDYGGPEEDGGGEQAVEGR